MPDIPQLFKDQVQDCLSHLYDYAFLQDHPIVRQLTPEIAVPQRVQVFRQLMIDSIEHFSPGAKVDFHSRQARTYNILLLRYIEGHDPLDVQQQLAFSPRQFYREHRRALEALSQGLWERTSSNTEESEQITAESNGIDIKHISVKSEIQRAFSHSEVAASDLNTFLEGISSAIRSLAERNAVNIEVQRVEAATTILEADVVTLRQAVILIAARLVQYAVPHGYMRFTGDLGDTYEQITIELYGSPEQATGIQEMFAQQEQLQYLLESLEGTLACEHARDGLLQLTVALPRRKHSILVVDDNPDVVDLFKRYLVGQSYQILAALESEHAIQLARDEQPELIVLDIMLPGKDGWELLQNFKNHPVTKHIPVLICSVLDAPDVAYSLGGDGYLRKPPGRSDFLNALARWQK
jgi:CheY-like chemotaxis protein